MQGEASHNILRINQLQTPLQQPVYFDSVPNAPPGWGYDDPEPSESVQSRPVDSSPMRYKLFGLLRLYSSPSHFRGAVMERSVRDILNLYNPNDPLDHAWTIPSPWYFDA